MTNKVISWINAAIIGTFIFIASLGGIVGFWMFQGVPECTTTENPVLVDAKGKEAKNFKAGDTFRVQRDVIPICKMTDIKVWRTISKAGNHEVVASDEFLPTPIKYPKERRTSNMKIPEDADPGHYVYRVFITYQVNPLRDGTFEMRPPVEFEVVK